MQSLLALQQAAFAQGAPDYARRMQALAGLRDGLRSHQAQLLQAVSEDFGGRAEAETLTLELFPLYDQIRHARRQLKRWMRRREVGSTWYLQPSRAFVQYQPLGVVGVIGAWNYQLVLTLGPLIDVLAAGNHAMVKPSEMTPRSAQVIADIIAERFAPDYVSCVTGGAQTAAAFSALPFNHLFFTGSTRVGQKVMQAAAANLTPVTLELGGKSPAIVHDSYPLGLAASRILRAKLYNAGQTCVAPDYLLLPQGREAEFEAHAAKVVTTLYPTLLNNPDYTRIVSHPHYQRLQALIDDAEQKGARVVRFHSDDAQAMQDNKLMAPMLVFGATDAMLLMQQEIFGPILPVVSCQTLDDAIDYVNARPQPLALYYFDEDMRRVDAVLAKTLSGGVTVNDCLVHLGQHNLPFGGVGQSGIGHYHGFDGFVTFSKKRGVMVQRRWAATALFRAPYNRRMRAMLALLVRLVTR